jgi:hypothetical protein
VKNLVALLEDVLVLRGQREVAVRIPPPVPCVVLRILEDLLGAVVLEALLL